ncbi:MAG: ABC transporter permease [Methylotenera sp.]|nr:ABC transporter permease [Methylotenera sp.]
MSWFNHHTQAMKLVLARMQGNKTSSLLICLVVAVAMCLPGLFYLGVDNLSTLTNHMQDETEISLFLKLDTSNNTITEIDELLAKNSAIKHYRLVSKEDAWKDLQAKSGADSAVKQLNKNPLPDAFFIQAKSVNPAELEALKTELQNIPNVEHALLNSDWAKRLSTLLQLGKEIIFFIAILLAIALLVIIGNTVRMQILTQKDEIEVSKLMGATSSFIRIPFLYAGIFYGLLGGLLAIFMMAMVIGFFNYSTSQISTLYNSDFRLSLFNGHLLLGIISLATFIGWLGAYLAVTRSIASIKIN